ncbi:unnamed protein product [Calypogeia fissa]
MGPRTGTQTDLGIKSYAPLSLGLACSSAGDKAAFGRRGVSVPSEWPLGHMSGPDGRGGAPKWLECVLVSGATIEPTGLGGSCVLALGLGAKNKGPELAQGWQVPEAYMRGVVSSRCLGRIVYKENPSGNVNGHNFGPSYPFGDLLVSLESL